jgi:hypothetical protein
MVGLSHGRERYQIMLGPLSNISATGSGPPIVFFAGASAINQRALEVPGDYVG